ncbi:hypothetical protein WR25_10927 isoform B [Diploscapter pachys]|uniref:G-protein coupled receptors family 1 profile domain-containing protein n=1 Tax=Diploscapter pachys TaxID=2018661 RepID=A0A2A2K7M3_9BILA|nr:hypothetical protein WR25_10927 isoform A [Diploscapter pachys]PAV69987.1 hypothetical protein WR25_10927 isoform B [Diploscapter pachys]
MAAQAFADIAYGVAFMLIAVRRLELNKQNRTAELTDVQDCAFLPALWLHNIATPLLGLIPMTMSFNFFICSVFPLWYLQATHKYTTLIISVPISIGALLMFVNAGVLWGAHYRTSIQCIASNGGADKIVYHMMLFFRIVANLASALIYAFIIAYLTKNHGGKIRQLSQQQRKMHRNAKITLGIVTANSMIFLFFPDILLFVDPWQITKRYSTLLYSMTLSKTTINIAIYMWRYRELRSIILLKLFGWIPCCEQLAKSSIGQVTDQHTRTIGDGPRSNNTCGGASRNSVAPEPGRHRIANRYARDSVASQVISNQRTKN